MSYYENYCVECDWSASKRDHSASELASLAIKHAIQAGHDIDSQQVGDESDTDFENEIGGARSVGAVGSDGYHEHS